MARADRPRQEAPQERGQAAGGEPRDRHQVERIPRPADQLVDDQDADRHHSPPVGTVGVSEGEQASGCGGHDPERDQVQHTACVEHAKLPGARLLRMRVAMWAPRSASFRLLDVVTRQNAAQLRTRAARGGRAGSPVRTGSRCRSASAAGPLPRGPPPPPSGRARRPSNGPRPGAPPPAGRRAVSVVRERGILMMSTGSRTRCSREECPVPKSSMATRTPRRRTASSRVVARISPSISSVSTISRIRRSAGTPESASALSRSVRKRGRSSWLDGDVHAHEALRRAGPARSKSASARPRVKRNTSGITPEASATGRKSVGSS